MTSSEQGKLVVISGPSGAGKTTVVRRLLRECPLPLRVSVSATTRRPRQGEQEGVDYFFLTPEQFAARRAAGEFLECFEVFGRGHWYGTLRDEVNSGLAQRDWVVLEIDVHGTMSVVNQHPEAITIFVQPESPEELVRRLRGRGTETEQTIQHRMAIARDELAYAPRYKHQVINRSLDQAVDDICEILRQAEDDKTCSKS